MTTWTRVKVATLVLGIVAAILVPRIVGSGDSFISEPKVEISTLKNLLDEFKLDN